jgi:hypothetical protein
VREELGVSPWLSTWSWEGFDVIYNDDPPHNALAYFLQSMSASLADEAIESNRARADKSDRGPVRSRLYEIIDTNRDGRMTAEELQAALRIPAHAQSISQLVIHYESEWYYQERKWDALDKVLGHTTSAPILNWVVEKERIKQLSWWKEVAIKVELPEVGRIYYLHPVGVMTSLSEMVDENDIGWLKVPYGQLTFDVEGNDIEDGTHPLYRYFSRVAHWLGGVSGVTIGRGYDLGQRPTPAADLRAAGIQEPLLSWLMGAEGLKGEAARIYLNSAPANVCKQRITRKQHDLFLPVYTYMKERVVEISSKKDTREVYGVLCWEETNWKIRDVVVDLIYRGDYTGATRRIIQKPFVDNYYLNFSRGVYNYNNWPGVPVDRFNRRVSYLRGRVR